MSFEIRSDNVLAEEVARHREAPPGAVVREVPELSGTTTMACGREDLLGWMGWLTAGPPSLTAEALRTAGAWALVRYFWALGYNSSGSLAPTPAATAIRHHNRVSFSEAVGVGVGGRMACRAVAAGRPVLVANLDDLLDDLVDRSVLAPLPPRSKHPDYLLFSPGRAGWQLTAIECKGTVSGLSSSVEQMARGIKQVQALESHLPLRRLVFGSTLELDRKQRELKAFAVEAPSSAGGGGHPAVLAEALLDAALRRALRIAGLRDLGRAAPDEDEARGRLQIPEANLQIGRRPLVGVESSWSFPGGTIEAAVGVSVEVLRALAGKEEREARLLQALGAANWNGTPRRTGETSFEYLMPDGTGMRLSWTGLPEEPPEPFETAG